MNLIVSAAGLEAFLLEDVDAGTPVAVLRLTLAERLHVPSTALKLVVDGVELLDGDAPAQYTLQDFYVAALSTIRCIVQQAAAAAPPSAGAGAAAGWRGDAVLQVDEVGRAVVLLHLPRADAAATEEAIFKAFSRYGEIARLVFQDEPTPRQAEAGGAPSQPSQPPPGQRALIVYYRDASAASALAADGSPILGQAVHVLLATNLPGLRAAGAETPAVSANSASSSSGGGASGPRVGHVPLIAPAAAAAVASLIAQGALYGEQGVAHLRRYDEAKGLSRRIRVAVDASRSVVGQLDNRFRIASSVRAGYEMAAQQARALNANYHVSEKVELGIGAALSKAAELTQRAMQNPMVSSLVTSGAAFIREAQATVESIAQQARQEVRSRQQRTGSSGEQQLPPHPNAAAAAAGAAQPHAEGARPLAAAAAVVPASASGAEPTEPLI